jgi:trans-aconitate 2-methyltransferase
VTAWSPEQYLKFEDERSRPARDLLAAIPLIEARRVVDLGCGPGNSTELIARRFPAAEIVGLDNSPDMLAVARKRVPDARFVEADLATWRPEDPVDLLFANAVFQWIPNHLDVLVKLLETLPAGGVLAVQMPDNLSEPSHRAMRSVAEAGPWKERLAGAAGTRSELPPPSVYYDRLELFSSRVEIWHTVYYHTLTGPAAIVEWVTATGLRPFLAPLEAGEREAFLKAYQERLANDYPARIDGTVLFWFPRLFVVAVRI